MPVWSDDLRDAWIKDFVEAKDFSNPIYSLVFWRGEYGLESLIAFRRNLRIAYTSPSEYSMCSPDTQNLAQILVDYRMTYCCDDRVYNFYPLLDRIIAWMDTFYGTKAKSTAD